MNRKKIGIIGLQGAFYKHKLILDSLGAKSYVIKYAIEVDSCDGLIIPGGESTTISKLLKISGMFEKIRSFKGPIFGTCAGAILLSKKCDNNGVIALNLIPIVIRRNAYGRQVDSFTNLVELKFDKSPFPAVFIRAPKIVEFESNVEVLGTSNGEVVFVQYKNILLSTFHPELTDDVRIHKYFITNMFE